MYCRFFCFSGAFLNIYLLVWIALTLFLIGFWVWSVSVLYTQKRAWKVFAKKRQLRYRSNRAFESPEISGSYQDFEVLVFTAEHEGEDGRMTRRLTSIEVSLHSSIPTSGAIASGGMVKLVEGIHFQAEFRPDISGWDDSYIVRSRDNAVMKAYLNDKRVQELIKLMKIKNAWIILFFSGGRGLLRIDTPDPLHNPKNLDDFLKQMIAAAKILELERGETNRLNAVVGRDVERGRERTSPSVIEASSSVFEEPVGLMLEEDEG